MMDSGHSFLAALLSAVSLVCTLDVRGKASDLARDLANYNVAHTLHETCPDCRCPACSPCPACNCDRSPVVTAVTSGTGPLLFAFLVGVITGLCLVAGWCACYQCCWLRHPHQPPAPLQDRRNTATPSPTRSNLGTIVDYEVDVPLYTPRSLRR